MEQEKQLFRNTTQGHVGVVTMDRRGERFPIAVGPGETVWLSEEEREATARAPREARHNPFVDQPFVAYDEHGEVIERGTRPQLVLDNEARPTGDRPIGSEVAAATPGGTPPEGSFATGEEVGVPQPVGFGQ